MVGVVTVDNTTNMGSYTLDNTGNNGGNQYQYRLIAELGANGLLTFSHDFVDDANKTYALTAANEDTQLAQQLYFKHIWSDVDVRTEVATSSLGLTDVSDDLFEVTVGVNNALGTALDSELAGVSGETLLTSLHFTVDAISLDNDNKLSQWANHKGYNGYDDSKLFEDGQVIWVNDSGLTENITLVMNDYQGTAQTMITQSLGIKLVQGTTGARA